MGETKTYIIEIPQVLGDETTIYLEADGNAVKSLFAIVEVSDGGASIPGLLLSQGCNSLSVGNRFFYVFSTNFFTAGFCSRNA
jgi:hypothetical protein